MKIVQYAHQSTLGTIKRMGILLHDNTIVDPNYTFAMEFERAGRFNPTERANTYMPSSLFELLSKFNNPMALLEEAMGTYYFHQKIGLQNSLEDTPGSLMLDEQLTSLACPIDKISTYRDFYSHEKHVKKGFEKRNEAVPQEWYEIPVYYKGATTGFIGTGKEIIWPSFTNKLDYELELAAVIGKEGKNIREEFALEHIFGFTILNDISARDIQKKEMKCRLGPSKSKDFCSILGPVILTTDEFDNQEPRLLMQAFINNIKWSEGNSGDSHYSFAQMITFASLDEWILPGDLIGSGTVGTGCGLEIDKWIKPGDVVELRVEKIGSLINTVGFPQKKDW